MADSAAAPPRFAAAAAEGSDGPTAVANCLAALGAPPPGANLGMVYATYPLAGALEGIVSALSGATAIEHWVGTTGLGVAASGVEYHDRPALAVLVGALPDDGFRLFQPIRDSLEPFQQQHGPWVARTNPVFGIVHGDPRNQHIAALVEGLSAETSTFLVGGLTAGEAALPQVAGGITDGGLSGVLFSPELPVVAGLSQGCAPVGAVRVASRAEGSVIMEIDGRPAVEVLKDDIGETLARDLGRIGGTIFVAFPITGTDTGDYLVRNLMGIDPERGWIAVGAEVASGARLMFCRRDRAAAQHDLKRMLADVKRRADTAPKAAVYYSCVARGPSLFGGDSEELRMIRDALGDLPLAGFFGNGEISNNRLYGYTGVLALFL